MLPPKQQTILLKLGLVDPRGIAKKKPRFGLQFAGARTGQKSVERRKIFRNTWEGREVRVIHQSFKKRSVVDTYIFFFLIPKTYQSKVLKTS